MADYTSKLSTDSQFDSFLMSYFEDISIDWIVKSDELDKLLF